MYPDSLPLHSPSLRMPRCLCMWKCYLHLSWWGAPFLSLSCQKMNNPLPSFFYGHQQFYFYFPSPFSSSKLAFKMFWWSVNYLIIFSLPVLLATKTLSKKINISCFHPLLSEPILSLSFLFPSLSGPPKSVFTHNNQ